MKIHSKLLKRHWHYHFHRIHEAIAAKLVVFFHMNIPSKHWGNLQIWSMLRPLLFWHGYTIALGQCELRKVEDQWTASTLSGVTEITQSLLHTVYLCGVEGFIKRVKKKREPKD